MEEMPSLNMPVQRLKAAVLPLDLPCSGPVTDSGEILTTSKSHGKKPDRFSYNLLYVMIMYRVIQKSLRDFRPLRYSSRDGHAEGEHVNRGRDTPSFCPTLQVLDTSSLGDAADVNPVIKFLPHTCNVWITLYVFLSLTAEFQLKTYRRIRRLCNVRSLMTFTFIGYLNVVRSRWMRLTENIWMDFRFVYKILFRKCTG